MKTANYSNQNKMAALSENGVMMDPNLMQRDNTYWLWFSVWYGDYIIDSTGSVGNTYTESSMVSKVYGSDSILTLKDLPDYGKGTPSVTPAPMGDFTLSLSNSDSTEESTNTITNNILIKHTGRCDIDLSKLSIRYYYTKEGISPETIHCDTTAVQYNREPWYISYISSANASFHKILPAKKMLIRTLNSDWIPTIPCLPTAHL